MKKSKLGLIITMLIWGSIGIFVRNINSTSSQIALVRALVGSIFLIIFSLFSNECISKENIKSNFIVLICAGICLGFNWIFLFQAYKYSKENVEEVFVDTDHSYSNKRVLLTKTVAEYIEKIFNQ